MFLLVYSKSSLGFPHSPSQLRCPSRFVWSFASGQMQRSLGRWKHLVEMLLVVVALEAHCLSLNVHQVFCQREKASTLLSLSYLKPNICGDSTCSPFALIVWGHHCPSPPAPPHFPPAASPALTAAVDKGWWQREKKVSLCTASQSFPPASKKFEHLT